MCLSKVTKVTTENHSPLSTTHGNKVIKTKLHKTSVSRKQITGKKEKQANSTFHLSFIGLTSPSEVIKTNDSAGAHQLQIGEYQIVECILQKRYPT